MGKRILVVAVLLVFALSAVALAGGGITGKGVKAGVNFATHRGSDTDDYHENRTAFAGGAFLTYGLTPMLAVQPEFLYTQKGYKWEHGGWKWTGRYNYIEIPILFKVMVPMEGSVRPSFFAGLTPAFLLSAEEDWEYTNGIYRLNDYEESGTVDVKDDTKSFDMGIVFGGAVGIPIGNGVLIFDARYNMGMMKIYDVDEDYDIKNSVISIMAGYGIQ